MNVGVIIALPAAGACVALGVLSARRLARREEMLAAWEGALIRLEGAVIHSGGGLRDALRRSAGKHTGILEELAQRMEEAPAAAPDALIGALAWDPLLTPPEREALSECLFSLFSPSPDGQARGIAYARDRWAAFRRAGREALEKNNRLYISLGWLGGAALFILMC